MTTSKKKFGKHYNPHERYFFFELECERFFFWPNYVKDSSFGQTA